MANALTACRLLLIPVIFRLILEGSSFAIVVFGVAAVTDLLDGAVARGTNRVTELGRLLDPLADRLFISSATLALYIGHLVPPLWALALLLARDAVILVGSAWLRLKRRPVEVTLLGKTATTVLLVAILLLVAGFMSAVWLFYAGLTLYLGSGFNYLVRGKKLMAASYNHD